LSIQEERFSQIANAIREKDGTTAPIRALDFAPRIRAIQTGSGGASCGIEVLETGRPDMAIYGEALVMPEFTAVPYSLDITILEGYT